MCQIASGVRLIVSACSDDPNCCRYPFLLVDRVIEIEYGKYAVGYKNITSNDEFFNGHFPERAIMPGELNTPPAASPNSVCDPM